MPYLYANAHRRKEDDEIPFESFLLHHKPKIVTPEENQAMIDAQAEVMKARFIGLAERMRKNKPADG